jgi:mRNA interferase HigB
VRIIAQSTLRSFAEEKRYAAAKGELALWVRVVEKAEWKHLLDVQKDFTTAEAVPVRKVSYTVFNICRNQFRLIVMINYQKGIIWVKSFLTHAEYSKNTWKKVLEEEQEQREALEKKLRRSK